MKKIFFLFIGLTFFTFKNEAQTTVTDIDGNIYNTVTIGTQVWMKENLKVTHYRNGVSIPNVKNGATWGAQTTGARCYFYNDSTVNGQIYGCLYNWYVVDDSSKLCPIGWHVPSDVEFTTLITYLGGDSVAGGKLKETDTMHWYSPNIGATNETGFTALPGGWRGANVNSWFNNIGMDGSWWSSSSTNADEAWLRRVDYRWKAVNHLPYDKGTGRSIRCLQDSTTQINEFNYPKDMKIFPIPTIDRINIDFNERQDIKIQIFNVIGELIFKKELDNNKNEIDISALSAGLYIIKIIGGNWTVQKKIIKQ